MTSGCGDCCGPVPPAHDAVLELKDSQRRALLTAARLAISVEPRGGSPTGVATGAVIYVVELKRRS